MERHLHYNLLQALWFLIFFVVVINAAKFAAAKWHVPGVSELIANT